MQRRAQASLEFLTTYGWALLVIMLAIGGLAYYGVFNVKDSISESCTVSPGFSCGEYTLTTTNHSVVHLRLRNGLGKEVVLSQAYAMIDGDHSTGCAVSSGLISHEGELLIDCSFARLFANKDLVKTTITITYAEAGGFSHTASSDLMVRARTIAAPACALSCDDDDPCTADSCDGGECQHANIAPLCASPEAFPCTQEIDSSNHCGTCPSGTRCPSEDFYCSEEGCMLLFDDCMVPCDDGDPCTTDLCRRTECTHVPISCVDHH